MSLLEEVLKSREEAEQKPPCQKCKYLFWIDKETPFCKAADKFILPELPPNKCELKKVEADFKQIDKKWECNKCKRGCVSYNGKTFAVNGLIGSGESFVWLNPGEYAPCGYLVEEKEVEQE